MRAGSLNIEAKVIETKQIAAAIRLIRFDVPPGVLEIEAGAHVTFDVPKGGRIITRSYSVVDDGKAPDALTIAVRLEPASKGGSKYMCSLKPGDSIVISGNGNVLRPAFSGQSYLILAGGIGVTPMTGMVRALKRTGKPLSMVYCARAPEDAAFVPELREALGDALHTRFDSLGQTLNVPELIAGLAPNTLVFMCGPRGMMDAVKSAWRDCGLPIENLRYETFANSGSLPSVPFRVTVEETGRSVEVGEDESLLDALLDSGHEVLSDCRRGECGLCKLHVIALDGPLDHRDVFLSEHERAAHDSICACVSRLGGGHMHLKIDDIHHGRSA